MKIQPYIEKLNTSQEFKKFNKDHKDAFVIAGFFVFGNPVVSTSNNNIFILVLRQIK